VGSTGSFIRFDELPNPKFLAGPFFMPALTAFFFDVDKGKSGRGSSRSWLYTAPRLLHICGNQHLTSFTSNSTTESFQNQSKKKGQ